MDLGVALPTSGSFASHEAIVRVAQEAERLGYAALWTYERILYPLEKFTYPDGSQGLLPNYYLKTFEPIETLTYVAAKTERIKLGTSIINAPFHTPVELARRFTTLDHFSNGRVIIGLGQGQLEQEFIAANSSRKYQGPGVSEFIRAMRAAWGENPVKFEGKFYNIPISNIDPKPIQKGGIPIVMGASSPAGIKRAARISDGFNPAFQGNDFATIESAIKAFRAAAEEAGRDPFSLKTYVRINGSITATPLAEDGRTFLWGSPDQIARDLDQMRKLRVDQVFFAEYSDNSNLDEYIESLAKLQAIVRA